MNAPAHDVSPPEGEPPLLPTHKAIVLVVDLVESVQLMQADERGVIDRWQRFVAHVQQRVLPPAGGRLVKSLGDGLMIEFAQASPAVAAASAMHEWMRTQCAPLADGRRLALRAGLHASMVYDATIDIYGVGVNLAARVATLAEGGETIATVELTDLLADALDADVEDLGEVHLKHVDSPVRVYRLGPASHPLSLPRLDSADSQLFMPLAVIPFVDLSPSVPANGIGDLIADGMIGQLSQTPGLHVVSRLSSAPFRSRALTPAQVAARLGVRFIVSGTYALVGPQVLVSAELADAQGGLVLWSGRVRGDCRDLLDVDSELIHELADAVHRNLLDAAVSKAISRPLPALSSYELFLGGIAMMHRASAREFDASRRLLESLTERHRRIATPYAWLGKWYVLHAIQGEPGLPHAAEMALQCTARALDLEPSSAHALAIEGFVHCHLKKDLDAAEARLCQACVLNPSEGLAWLFLAVIHAFKGEPDAALAAARRALALSPMDPLRYHYESLMASCEFGAGHHAEAIAWCERSLRRNRQHLSTLRILIAADVQLGREAQARAAARELMRLRPGYTVAAYEARSVAARYPFGQRVAAAMRAAGIP